MRVMILAAAIIAICFTSALGQTSVPRPPGSPPQQVVVNSQQTLIDVVGDGFRNAYWWYPGGLVPTEFPELKFVSWPTDHSRRSWRKPIILSHQASGVRLNVNCYHRRENPVAPRGKVRVTPAAPRTAQPSVPLKEPNYEYKAVRFHNVQAAVATTVNRDVIAFQRNDILFKVEASGGTAEMRRKLTVDIAQEIWELRRPK